MKNIVLISGPAGSGLSSAEFVFEELGYYVVKNAPCKTITSIAKEIENNEICFVCHPKDIEIAYLSLKEMKDVSLRFIVLSCEEKELMKRFTLTRHVHPRSVVENITAEEAIEKDVRDITKMLEEADYSIDTTSLTVKQLRSHLFQFLTSREEENVLSVTFISFGLKNGIPQGLDTFIDVRSIPNPFWVEELKELTGADQKVIDYMNSFPITKEIIDNITRYLESSLKEASEIGRTNYVVGVACSGGQHRSTYVANLLKDHFAKLYRSNVYHRDTPNLNNND